MNRAQGVAPDSADVNPDRFSLPPLILSSSTFIVRPVTSSKFHREIINFHSEIRSV